MLTVVVSGRVRSAGPGATTRDLAHTAPKRAVTSDSSRLLDDIPGVSLFGAGGISGLPVSAVWPTIDSACRSTAWTRCRRSQIA